MIIDCTSDLHGYLPELEGGDLLIIAGDITASDRIPQWNDFFNWVDKQQYKKKVMVAGNHDGFLKNCATSSDIDDDWYQQMYPGEGRTIEYLCDSGIEFEGLKIWGSPWTKGFSGMNPHCKAFTLETEKELLAKWELIPEDIDILITHSPSNGVLDEVKDYTTGRIENFGSCSLIKPMVKSGCRLHVFGHIHASYGKFFNPINGITYVNASHVNEEYEPVNKPIRVIL